MLALKNICALHTLAAEELRGRPEDLIHVVPWGQEVVVTREGRPVAVLASMRGGQAEMVLRALRRLRRYRSGSPTTARSGCEDGPWEVYNQDCTAVLGRRRVFEDAHGLATRLGLLDPVIAGGFDDAQLLFVGLGPLLPEK